MAVDLLYGGLFSSVNTYYIKKLVVSVWFLPFNICSVDHLTELECCGGWLVITGDNMQFQVVSLLQHTSPAYSVESAKGYQSSQPVFYVSMVIQNVLQK